MNFHLLWEVECKSREWRIHRGVPRRLRRNKCNVHARWTDWQVSRPFSCNDRDIVPIILTILRDYPFVLSKFEPLARPRLLNWLTLAHLPKFWLIENLFVTFAFSVSFMVINKRVFRCESLRDFSVLSDLCSWSMSFLNDPYIYLKLERSKYSKAES